MGPVIIRRLLVSMPALIGVLFLCFCLLQVVPSDPGPTIAGITAAKVPQVLYELATAVAEVRTMPRCATCARV
jgi:ABC-type dipeptide/oligopeptide/nickel transport system permease component